MQSPKIFRAIPATPLQHLKQRERRKSGIFSNGRPDEGTYGQHVCVYKKNVDEVARFVAAREREHLVDGEIHRMEEQAAKRVADERHEAPRRIASPIHSRGIGAARNNRADEPGLADLERGGVAGRIESLAV